MMPDGRGPWTFVVEAVGSPRDGQQRATLGPPPDPAGSAHAPGAPIRVAATLPAYPAVIPGDIVVAEGKLATAYNAYKNGVILELQQMETGRTEEAAAQLRAMGAFGATINEQSELLNARLVLLLANHVGDLSVLREAIELAHGRVGLGDGTR